MIPKNRRIPRNLYNLFSNNGFSYKREPFLVKIIENKGNQSRFSVSVSKKIAKKAVSRNKLRRIAYREIIPYLNMVKNDYLIRFSFFKIEYNKDVIKKSILNIFEISNLINK